MLQLSTLQLIQYSLALPLIAALFSAVIPFKNIRDILVVCIAALLPFLSYKIYQFVIIETGVLEWRLFEIIPGIAIDFRVEPLGIIFAIILSVLWVLSLIYAIGYMRSNKQGNQNSFFAFFSITIFAALGVAFAGNLLTLFIFYELITLTTYPLVTYNNTDESKKAGRIYIAILLGTSVLFFLPAIILTFNAAGTLDFIPGGILKGTIPGNFMMWIFILYVFGTAKSAIMPLHKWLPAAMVAPAPVSGLLHAVAVVKVGVFSIIKIAVYIFGIDNLSSLTIEFGQYGDWFLYLSAFTVLLASVIALTKNNLKKLLAYSTISQLGYVLLSLAMFSPKGLIAAILQIVAHAFAKIVMFFAAGAIYTVSHKRRISELSGLGRSMPFTFAAFAIAAVSMIGLPPAIGFFPKWNMVEGAMVVEQYLIITVIAVSTMLNAAYFLPIIYKAFFEKSKHGAGIVINRKHGEAPFLMVMPTCLIALLVFILFIWPEIFFKLAVMVGK